MIKHLLIFLLQVYKRYISPLLPAACRFMPTCSEYAMGAIGRFGAFKGGWLALKRLLRCQPFGTPGFDPVPEFWPGFFKH